MMNVVRTDDGVDLCYESIGIGSAILFVHEFAGDMHSWEPQVRYFSDSYQIIRFNARGYPPSSVPPKLASYSQNRAVADIAAVMDHAQVERAHIVGLSMGGFATLHFGLQHPGRALSLCIAGCGYGSEAQYRDSFRDETRANASILLEQGMVAFSEHLVSSPFRTTFQRSDPGGFAEFKDRLATHSALGSANTQLGVQRERPSLYTLTDELGGLTVPTLIIAGDDDTPCLQPSLMLKQTIPFATLAVIPDCGHTINLEAPIEFNRILAAFLDRVTRDQ